MAMILGILVLVSPIAFFMFGYWIGRYGSPIRLSVHRPSDRRKRRNRHDNEDDIEDELAIYRVS